MDAHFATVIYDFVSSSLDYCNELYQELPLKTIQRLKLMQNEVARLLSEASQWEPTGPWVEFKVLVMTYIALNDLGLAYQRDRFSPCAILPQLQSAGGA